MVSVRTCRQFALQCFRSAVNCSDPVRQHGYVVTARFWLETANEMEGRARVGRQPTLH
jgi:hypothetical protein